MAKPWKIQHQMKIPLTKPQLHSLYTTQRLSIRQVAYHIKCSPSGIKRLLHKYNIPRRNKCASLNLCPDEFTSEEYEFLIGTMLGDGHITKPRGPNGECQLVIGHSPKQKKYIEYKYKLMHRFVGCKIYELNHTLKNGKKYKTLNFSSRKSHLFTKLRDEFYPAVKAVPFDLLETHLSAFGLAVWYMDDGYNSPNKGCQFCTQSFSKEDNERLIEFFKEKFGIFDVRMQKAANHKWRLYIPKKPKKALFDIISPHVIVSMEYKLR